MPEIQDENTSAVPKSDSLGNGSIGHLRAVIDMMPNGICVIDSDRKIRMINALAANIIGASADTLIGSLVDDLYAKRGISTGLDMDALRRGERVNREVELVHPDGEFVPILTSARLVHDEDEGGDFVIEAWFDQTAKRRLERMKSEFVYVAAHELRNPVTAMQLLLDIIFEDKRLDLHPVLRNYLLKMTEANQRLLQLVDDLLEASKSDVGKLKIKAEDVDMVALTNDVVNELTPIALAKDVVLTFKSAPGTPPVYADVTKVREILSNLLSNAIKYNIIEGSVTVSHEIRGNMLATKISDTGIGIRETDMSKLFSKLWRSEDKAVRSQSGTGLGLFIVKELVERMGGGVAAESQYGKGTTMTFTLPVAK